MDAITSNIHNAADVTYDKKSYTPTLGGEAVAVACVHGIFSPKLFGTPTIPY